MCPSDTITPRATSASSTSRAPGRSGASVTTATPRSATSPRWRPASAGRSSASGWAPRLSGERNGPSRCRPIGTAPVQPVRRTGRQGLEGTVDHAVGRGDDGRQPGGDAVAGQRRAQLPEPLGRAGQVDAQAAVALQVDVPGRHEEPVGVDDGRTRHRRRRSDQDAAGRGHVGRDEHAVEQRPSPAHDHVRHARSLAAGEAVAHCGGRARRRMLGGSGTAGRVAMFVQLIEGRTTDAEGLERQGERWQDEVKPGAVGYLGVTSGVTADGRSIAIVRFESEEAARANSDRPEQSAWWADTSKFFEGDVEFSESSDVTEFLGGGSDEAGFVQVMKVSGVDRAQVERLDQTFEQFAEPAARPPRRPAGLDRTRPLRGGRLLLQRGGGTGRRADRAAGRGAGDDGRVPGGHGQHGVPRPHGSPAQLTVRARRCAPSSA